MNLSSVIDPFAAVRRRRVSRSSYPSNLFYHHRFFLKPPVWLSHPPADTDRINVAAVCPLTSHRIIRIGKRKIITPAQRSYISICVVRRLLGCSIFLCFWFFYEDFRGMIGRGELRRGNSERENSESHV